MDVYPKGRPVFEILKKSNLWHRGTEAAGTVIVLREVISDAFSGTEASES